MDLLFFLRDGWDKSDLMTLRIQLSLLHSAIDDDDFFNTSKEAVTEADQIEEEERVMFLYNIEMILANRLAMLYARSYFSSSSSSFSSSSLSSSSEAHQAAPLLSTALFDAFEATRSSTSSAKRESTEQ